MGIKNLISLVPEGENISLRACAEDNTVKYVITKNKNAAPDKRYKLYSYMDGKLSFTGKTSSSPIELEECIGF